MVPDLKKSEQGQDSREVGRGRGFPAATRPTFAPGIPSSVRRFPVLAVPLEGPLLLTSRPLLLQLPLLPPLAQQEVAR